LFGRIDERGYNIENNILYVLGSGMNMKEN
jgi:hypothetical protein